MFVLETLFLEADRGLRAVRLGGLDVCRVAAEHGVRLASACLAVHEDGAVNSFKRGQDDFLAGLCVNVCVVEVLVVAAVEGVGPLGGPALLGLPEGLFHRGGRNVQIILQHGDALALDDPLYAGQVAFLAKNLILNFVFIRRSHSQEDLNILNTIIFHNAEGVGRGQFLHLTDKYLINLID